MIGRLNHVAIAVPDLEAAAAQYRNTLGAKVNSVTIGAGGELLLNVDGVGPKQVSDVKEIL